MSWEDEFENIDISDITQPMEFYLITQRAGYYSQYTYLDQYRQLRNFDFVKSNRLRRMYFVDGITRKIV